MIKRSVSIRGHRTSISLEPLFWETLKEMAEEREVSVSALITEIDASRSRAMATGPVDGGLSSAIRVAVLQSLRVRLHADQ
ncbi:MAG TPA: aryl-sulfate sulfotransferase [Alphaproteobacteria bacterium]|jgi:predicted DNA-binding ribbon-helix-helix protein|nr:aryl-sulfate sulfotransferase [Alphaproteobacteria bacterium]|tara:strand:- start:6369 stop:6611 length:243 start_codon:yes stop_codon:yes gene_type:complete